MGPVGWQEMVIIFVVALVLFGPKKLPELGRTLGKAITEFRRASNELKSTFEREMQALEREGESIKDATRSYMGEIDSSYNSHGSGSGSGYDTNYGYDHSYDYGAYGVESHDATASNPTTVGESASQDAESHGAEAPADGTHGVPGTVARGSAPEAASHEAGAEPAEHRPEKTDVPQHS